MENDVVHFGHRVCGTAGLCPRLCRYLSHVHCLFIFSSLCSSTEKHFFAMTLLYPSSKKEGHNCILHVGQSVLSVSLNLVQLIPQERFAPEAPNLVGR